LLARATLEQRLTELPTKLGELREFLEDVLTGVRGAGRNAPASSGQQAHGDLAADRLSETAWNLFGQAPTGWGRVQAICDYVHRHITFGYEHARNTRTALEAFNDRVGVCRDSPILPLPSVAA
jgi:transglutaminase-like putative cysteine protease